MEKKSILVIQTAFLGDLILSGLLLKKLKQRFPNHNLILVVRSGLGSFIKSLGWADTCLEVKKGDQQSYQKAKKQLGKLNIEILISPHQSIRSSLFSRSIRAKRKISYRNWLSKWIYSDVFEYDRSLPDALRQLSMLIPLAPEVLSDIDGYRKNTEMQISSGSLPLIPTSLLLRHESKVKREKIICLFPGSVWPTKRWPKEKFIELGRKLSSSFQVLLMGGRDEAALCAEIAASIPGAISHAGKFSLEDSVEMLSRASLCISNDSGGQHLAALANCPVVSIFGPTTLEFGFRPWLNESRVVELKGLPCRPCGKHGHQTCPIGTHECMRDITAEKVYQQCVSLITI